MKRSNPSRRSRSNLLIRAAVPAVLGISTLAHAAGSTWNGGGTDNNWSTALNWTGGVPVSDAQASITFAGTTRLTPSQNIANPFILHFMRFDATATSPFTLSGSQLHMRFFGAGGAPAIENISTATHTINNSILLEHGGTFFEGNLVLGGVISGGAGDQLQKSNGTLILTADNVYPGTTVNGGGTLRIGDGTTTGSVAGNVSNSAALVFNRSDAFAYAGSISGAGSLTKSGGGSLTLSGSNSYGGTTTVSSGRLQFANRTSLYSATPANWTAARIIVESGAAAAFNVGGTGEFISADIDTLKALGTAGGGFKNGSILGQDTTNASGGNFVYGSVIADTNAGANVLGLQKLGGGTLTLTGNNTYTGTTTVTAGTLSLGGGTTSGSVAGSIVVNNGTNLVFNRSDTFTTGGPITGTGMVHKQGSGTLQLSGTPFSVGSFTHSAGTVEIAAGGASITVSSQVIISSPVTGGPLFASGDSFSNFGSGSVNTNGATLSFSSVHNISATFNAGAGPLVVSGGDFIQRTTLLSTTGAATFNMTSNAAPRQPFSAGSAHMAGSGAVFSNSGGTMTITNGGTITVPGTVFLNAPITAGSLTVSGGALTTSASGLGTITTTGGATFNMAASVGVFSPINAGAGPLSFSGTAFEQFGGSTISTTGAATVNVSSLTVFRSVFSAATLQFSDSSAHFESGGQVGFPSGSWTNSQALRVGVSSGTASLTIGSLATMTAGSATIGASGSSAGTVIVNGGTWTNTSDLAVGSISTGRLDVNAAATVTNATGVIGDGASSSGSVTVAGTGALWANSGNLTVGNLGTARLFVNTGGRVTVGGTTTIGGSGSIIMGGGTLEFGSMSIADYAQVSGSSGTLIGNVGTYSGFTDVSTLPAVPTIAGVNTAGVVVTNSGVMFGNAILNHGLLNLAAGEVETSGSERMRFLGNGTNSGQITNFGAQIRFAGSAINTATGKVQGRGQFIADGGWTNQGAMNFSGGFADVRGNVNNTGSIITTGNGVTTFFNNLVHNGSEVRTAPGSVTASFGLASGTGNFTGTGLVRFEGGYSPGASPGHVTFGGDVTFTSSSPLEIELGGLSRGTEYDAIDIAGLATLQGDVIVRQWNNFIPLPGQRFDVLTYASRVGDPGIINGTAYAGLWFEKGYSTNGLSLLAAALEGDASLNGTVDIDDFATLAAHFNQTSQTWLEGDFTLNGTVDIDDFAILGTNFNTSLNAARWLPPQAHLVPEPSAAVFAMAGGLLGRRRRSRA